MSETATPSSSVPDDYPAGRKVVFLDSVALFFKNYVNFKGRSSRGAYWWSFLAISLVNGALGVLDAAVFGWDVQDPEVFGNVFGLVCLIPNISIGVRRLHDVGRSGWWLLIFLTVIGIFVLLYWAVQPGDRETNKYGPDVEAGKSGVDQIAATFN